MSVLVVFLLFALSTIGATHIFVESEIISPFKVWMLKILKVILPKLIFDKLEYGVNCAQCSGMWIGMVISYFTIARIIDLGIPTFAFCFICGFAGSFLSNLTQWYLLYFESKYLGE